MTATFGLIGLGGHGRDIIEIIHRLDLEVKIYDDDAEKGLPSALECHLPAYLGVNDTRARWKMNRHELPPPLIDRDAHLGRGCWVDGGSVLFPDVRFLRDVIVGKHSHISYGVRATRARIGDFVTVSPGVTICGDVEIRNRVFIGAGAEIGNLLTIGEDAVIGAGATVLADVPPAKKVIGRWA